MHFPSLFMVMSSGTAHIIGTSLWDLVHPGMQSLPSSYDAQRKVLYPSVLDMWVQKAGAGMMCVKQSKSQNSPKQHQKSVTGDFFFHILALLGFVGFLPTKIWGKVTAAPEAFADASGHHNPCDSS